MNFIFIGGTFRGLKLLENLLQSNLIPDHVVILKEDDHEIDRYSSDLANLAFNHNVTSSISKKLTEKDVSLIRAKVRDFAIVCGWRSIIPFELNAYFRLGMIAAHDSLLPAYRGFAPINWAIINGEKMTGVTLFKITDGDVDSGPIYIQKKVPIAQSDTAHDVYKKVVEATIVCFSNFLKKYKSGRIKFRSQNERLASYTCKRSPADGLINWNQKSLMVHNFARALAPPYPGAFCHFNGAKFILVRTRIGANNHKKYIGSIPGRIVRIFDEGIEVLCKSGTIEILEWINAEINTSENPSSSIKSLTVSLY